VKRIAKHAFLVLEFIAHQIFCPYGLLVLSAFLTITAAALLHIWYKAATVHWAHWILTETPYYPVQISMALVAGFVIGSFRRIPFARWMWVLPLMILVGAILFEPISIFESRLDHFFGWGGVPRFHSPQGDELVFTLPFYISATYSATAFIVRRWDEHHQNRPMPTAS
jgi:hypothetical protein